MPARLGARSASAARGSWQRPDRVIESLGLGPGDRVADIGSGEGYITFKFADVVGPEGRLYAVDVDREVLRRLRQRVEAGGYSNLPETPRPLPWELRVSPAAAR